MNDDLKETFNDEHFQFYGSHASALALADVLKLISYIAGHHKKILEDFNSHGK